MELRGDPRTTDGRLSIRGKVDFGYFVFAVESSLVFWDNDVECDLGLRARNVSLDFGKRNESAFRTNFKGS